MSDVHTELGTSGQISLNDTNVRTLAGVASGAISMNDLRGKSSFSIVSPLTGGPADTVRIVPTNAYAGWRFNPDGTVDRMRNTTLSWNTLNQQQWFLPTGTAPATYYIKATLDTDAVGSAYGRTSTNPTSGTMGTWLALTSTRTWYNSRTVDSAGGAYSKFTIEIASDSGGTNIVASGTFDIEIELEI